MAVLLDENIRPERFPCKKNQLRNLLILSLSGMAQPDRRTATRPHSMAAARTVPDAAQLAD
jgi:hypothetical protein